MTLKLKAPGNSPLGLALAYLRGGVSVLPIRRDGTKGPALAEWKVYQACRPNEEEAESWWSSKKPPGFAAVCGQVSGGLEVLDFDLEADVIFAAWREEVEEASPGLLSRLCVVRTPKPGYHAWFRSELHPTPGNTELAAGPAGKLIETRGEGGYALLPGCPLECHESRRPYEKLSGPALWDLKPITAAERDILFKIARRFDRTVKVAAVAAAAAAPASHPMPHANGQLRPGDDFERRATWAEILEPRGWVVDRVRGDEIHWRRPGKDRGSSATTGRCKGQDGADLLRVFSSNALPFEAGQAYGKFNAYALLEHGGDHSAAAAALAASDYGEKRRDPRPVLGKVAMGPPTEHSQADEPDWKLYLDGVLLGQGSDEDKPELGRISRTRAHEIETLSRVMQKPYPEPRWTVHGLLSEGLNILAGAPKQGKSMLSLNLALTVAAGGRALGDRPVTQGDVLYLSLEDRMRRVKDRAAKMLDGLEGGVREDATSRLLVVTSWDRLDSGGLKQLELWIKSRTSPGLIIIDVWNRFCPRARGNVNAYSQDAEAMAHLKALADHHGVTVLVIHHTRKLPPGAEIGDFISEVSGSLGLAGTADGIMALIRTRGESQASLHYTGRDLGDGELVVEFAKESLTWRCLGTAKEYQAGPLQRKILDHLKKCGNDGATVTDLAAATGAKPNSLRMVLGRMRSDEVITRRGNNWVLPPSSPSSTLKPYDPDSPDGDRF